MTLTDIHAAFGADERLTYTELADRLGRPKGRAAAMRFAKVLAPFQIRPHRARRNGRTGRYYLASDFVDVIAHEGKPLSKVREPMSYEALRMKLLAAEGKIRFLRAEVARWRKLAREKNSRA